MNNQLKPLIKIGVPLSILGLTACSQLNNLSVPDTIDADLQGTNINNLLWEKQGKIDSKQILFKIENNKIYPIGDREKFTGKQNNLYCLTNTIPTKVCKGYDEGVYRNFSASNPIESIILLPVALTYDTLTFGKAQGLKSVTTKVDNELIQNVGKNLSISILSEYSKVRDSTNKLSDFINKYSAYTTHPIIIKDLAKLYNSSNNDTEKAKLEGYLVNDKMIKVQTLGNLEKEGLERDYESSVIFGFGMKNGKQQKYKQNYNISIDGENGLPITYNSYKVKVRFLYKVFFESNIKAAMVSGSTPVSESYYSDEEVILSASNGYQKDVTTYIWVETAEASSVTGFFAEQKALNKVVADKAKILSIEVLK